MIPGCDVQKDRMVFICGRIDHGAHVPHLMTCERLGCQWVDCPGEAGANFKIGCPICRSVYWRAVPQQSTGAPPAG